MFPATLCLRTLIKAHLETLEVHKKQYYYLEDADVSLPGGSFVSFGWNGAEWNGLHHVRFDPVEGAGVDVALFGPQLDVVTTIFEHF